MNEALDVETGPWPDCLRCRERHVREGHAALSRAALAEAAPPMDVFAREDTRNSNGWSGHRMDDKFTAPPSRVFAATGDTSGGGTPLDDAFEDGVREGYRRAEAAPPSECGERNHPGSHPCTAPKGHVPSPEQGGHFCRYEYKPRYEAASPSVEWGWVPGAGEYIAAPPSRALDVERADAELAMAAGRVLSHYYSTGWLDVDSMTALDMALRAVGNAASQRIAAALAEAAPPSDAYNAAQMEKWAALTDAERLARHEDDSYGGCVICLEYVPNTDDESVRVAFPCAPVLLARQAEAAPPSRALDVETALVAMYDKNPALIAEMCNEHLDRSGALLGRVRERIYAMHRAALSPTAEPVEREGS